MVREPEPRCPPPRCWCESSLEFPEDRMVPNRSGKPSQGSFAKFTYHEDLFRHVVLAAKEQTGGRKKTEAWVVLRVSQYNHTCRINLAASLESFEDET
jgi:hypothetical protein